MGKLQATLRKILTKAGPAESFAEKLSIPVQIEPLDSATPPDASTVKKWIIAFDAANSMARGTNGVTYAETLINALQRSNRSDCLPDVRLQIMGEYEKPFAYAMQSLDSRYLYLDFPITTQAEQSFQLAATLCREMAFGYKIAIVDSFTGSANSHQARTKKSHSKSSANRSTAIGCACKHLTGLALRHAQINRDWPDGIWADFHALINIAASDRTSDSQDHTTLCGLQHLTIEQQYACICALYVMDQKKLKAEDVRSLLVKLTRHADLIKLHSSPKLAYEKTGDKSSESNNSQSNIYSVGEHGAPLRQEFRLPLSGDTLLHFSLDTVIDKLTTEGDSDRLLHGCKRINRVESRAPRSTSINAETGLEKIHEIIKSAPPQENNNAQYTNLAELLTQQQIEAATELQADMDLLEQTTPSSGTSSFQVENQSSNGFGLKWTGDGSCAVQAGELLAHKYRNTDNEVSWHLSIVRWLRSYADGTLRLGVQSLSRHTTAVDVVRWINPQHETETPVEGLLINYRPIDNKAKMLVLPLLKYKAGETVGYRDSDGFHMVKLIENVDIHADYQCFATLEIETESAQPVSSNNSEYQVAV